MLLQGCGVDSEKQEMLHVDQGKVGHAPLQQLMIGIYGYQPVETEERMLRSCKDGCSWQQDEGCPSKEYVISFMREGSMHIGQWSAFC